MTKCNNIMPVTVQELRDLLNDPMLDANSKVFVHVKCGDYVTVAVESAKVDMASSKEFNHQRGVVLQIPEL